MEQISIFHLSLSFVCLTISLVLTLLYFGGKLFDSTDEEVLRLRQTPAVWFFYKICLITWVFFRRLQLHANFLTTALVVNYFPALARVVAERKYAKLSEEHMAVELRATAHVYLMMLAELNELRPELDPDSIAIAEQSLSELKVEYERKRSVFVRTYPESKEDLGSIAQ